MDNKIDKSNNVRISKRWYDHDYGLWEDIQKSKKETGRFEDRNTNRFNSLPDVHGILVGRLAEFVNSPAFTLFMGVPIYFWVHFFRSLMDNS